MSLSKQQIAAIRTSSPDPDQLRALFSNPLNNVQWNEILDLRKIAFCESQARGGAGRKLQMADGVGWAQIVTTLRVEPKRSKRLADFEGKALKTLLIQDGKGWWQDPTLFYLIRIQLNIPVPAGLPTGSVSAEQDFEALKSKFREYKDQAMAYYEPSNGGATRSQHSERIKWAETLIFACDNILVELDRSSRVIKPFGHIIREAELAGYARAFLEMTRDPKKLELNTKAAAFFRTESPLIAFFFTSVDIRPCRTQRW